MLREFKDIIRQTYPLNIEDLEKVGVDGETVLHRCPSAQLLIVSAMRDELLRGHFEGFMLNFGAVSFDIL